MNQFVRVLVVLFANPRSVIRKMGFSQQDETTLLAILVEILGKYSNPDEVINTCLDVDSERKKILEEILSSAGNQLCLYIIKPNFAKRN